MCVDVPRAKALDANLGAAVERVVVSRTAIEIELAESAAGDDHNRILIIPGRRRRRIGAARSSKARVNNPHDEADEN
jgi:hypothetical protein